MPKVIEVLLSKTLSLSIFHLWLVERVVDYLKGFPIALGFQKFVHMLFGGTIAVFHDPSMERDEPDFFEENLDVTRGIVVNHHGNIFNGHSLVFVTSISSISLTNERNDRVNEFSEVFTNWKIDKDVLEQADEIFTGET
jgi:hypothetical protein